MFVAEKKHHFCAYFLFTPLSRFVYFKIIEINNDDWSVSDVNKSETNDKACPFLTHKCPPFADTRVSQDEKRNSCHVALMKIAKVSFVRFRLDK